MVVFGGFAFRHFVVGDVGDGTQQLRHLLLSLCHLLVHLLRFLLQLCHLSLYLFGLVLLTLLHQPANLARELLLLVQTLVEFLLGLAALLVDGLYLLDGFLGIGEVFLFQTANYAFGFLIDEFEC